jgi:heat shock protein HslJ
MRMRTLIVGLAMGSMALAACTTAGGSGGTLDGVHWGLISQVVDGKMTDISDDVLIDATFDAGTSTVSGSSGCNRYTGPYTASGSNLTFGALASTQMACAGNGGTQEPIYLANLAASKTFTATTSELTIFNGSGHPILIYAAVKPGQMGNVTWHATGINNGNDAVVSVEAGTDPTAVYDPAGTVSGSGGCNTFNGPAVVDGTSIKIGPLASTKMACANEAASTQEAQYFAALEAATTFELSGNTLVLRDADGAMQVTFESR